MKFLNLLLILTAGAPLAAFSSGVEQAFVGTLGQVKGMVFVDRVEARSGTRVRETSVIETSPGARATLLLGDGALFHLAENTTIRVSDYSKSDGSAQSGKPSQKATLELKVGRLRGLVLDRDGSGRRDIRIRARSATMGVRGTEILVDVPQNSAESPTFFTVEGSTLVNIDGQQAPVALSSNQGVQVNAPAREDVSGGGQSGSAPVSQGISVNAASVSNVANDAGLKPPDAPRSAGDTRSLANANAPGTKPPGPPPLILPPPPSFTGPVSIPSAPQVFVDPVADGGSSRVLRVLVQPCSAAAGASCP
jgi:hypothetical protein